MPGTIYTQAPNTAAVVAFSRFEPRAVDVNLETTLEVQVHDALWMLTQQWRMGEYKGSDAGSAVRAKVNSKSERISRFKSFKSPGAIDYLHDKPLEAMAENMPLKPDLLLKVQMGKYFLKDLRRRQGNNNFFDEFKAYFKIETPTIDSQNHANNTMDEYNAASNKELLGLLNTFNANALDGYALFEFALPNVNNILTPGIVLANPPADPLLRDHITNACQSLIEWYQNTFSIPSTNDVTWSEQSLEYKFKVSAPNSGGQTVLNADGYRNGNLDWYDFDISNVSNETLGGSSQTSDAVTSSYIPVRIQFKGMPVSRWWEFEYASLDIGNMMIGKQDMLKMMIQNFGQIYSNDWLILPLALPVGSICEIKHMLVTDVFGKHTLVNPAGTGQDNEWQRWSMFNLNIVGEQPVPGDLRLLIPPSTLNRLESEPFEKVIFLKDEMANMVWAIEDRIPDGIKGGTEGKLGELNLHNYFRKNNFYEASQPSLNPNNAEISFKLSNSLPEYWIPFIPVKDTSPSDNRSIKYRRAKFKRIIDGINTDDYVSPRTSILKPSNSDPYFLNEEEILKPGLIVKSTFQRARWYNGEVVTWMGRSRTNGRGEGRSGLKFDQIVNKD